MSATEGLGIVYVAGHAGLAGSAIVRALRRRGHTQVVTQTRAELDLTNAREVDRFFDIARPHVVVLAAARVGGILENDSRPAEFIRENLLIQTNVIHVAQRHDVRKLLFLGSSCIYPRLAPQPLTESSLMTGPLEPTNEAYAMAKLAGIAMCQAYRRQYGFNAITALPTNLYGPNDNFEPYSSHVIPGLMRRLHDARAAGDTEFVVWGTGEPRREFLHADDFADAACLLLDRYDEAAPINVGCGEDVPIRELADLLARIIGYKGRLVFDASRPDGTPRKLLDVAKLRALGFTQRLTLEAGLRETYRWFMTNR